MTGVQTVALPFCTPSRSPAGPTPAIETMIRSRVSCLAGMYPSFHAPAPPGTRMSYHIRQRRPAGEAATATATAGRQKVIGTRPFSDTYGASSVTAEPRATVTLGCDRRCGGERGGVQG